MISAEDIEFIDETIYQGKSCGVVLIKKKLFLYSHELFPTKNAAMKRIITHSDFINNSEGFSQTVVDGEIVYHPA